MPKKVLLATEKPFAKVAVDGKMRLARTGFAVLLTLVMLSAPAHSIERWQKTFGGAGNDWGWWVRATPDSGYIVAGATNSFGAGQYDFYLLKLDSLGDTLWTRTYGGTQNDVAYSVEVAEDGGYIVAGWTRSFGMTAGAIYVVKTNAVGDTQWTRKYLGTYYGLPNYQGWRAFPTADNGYLITGPTSTGLDFRAIKINATGDSLWARTYGTSAKGEWPIAAQPTADSGCIMVGSQGPLAVHECPYLVKTDADGDTMWTKVYTWPVNDDISSIETLPDGGYIIAGATNSFGAGMCDGYIMRIDSLGDSLWMHTYGGPNDDWPSYVNTTSDGGYILAGGTVSFGAGGGDIYLVRTDSLGDTLWTRTFGGSDYDDCSSVQQAPDGGYIIAGLTMSSGAGGQDVFIIKTDTDGFTGTGGQPPIGQPPRAVPATAAPNPFRSWTSILGHEREQFRVYNVAGKLVGEYSGGRVGGDLEAGVYFAVGATDDCKVRKLVKIK